MEIQDGTFGSAVAIDSKVGYAMVGNGLSDEFCNDSGSIYLFKYDSTIETWLLNGKSVAIYENKMVFGSTGSVYFLDVDVIDEDNNNCVG